MAKQKGVAPRKQSDGMSIVAAMLVGGVVTMGVGFFLYLWNPFNQNKTPAVNNETPMVRPKVQATSTPKPNYEFYDLLPDQKITGLPKQAIKEGVNTAINPNVTPDVVVAGKDKSTKASIATAASATPAVTTVANPLAEPAKAKAKTPDSDALKGNVIVKNEEPNGHTYILQVNSYTNVDEADRRRAQVLMAGVDAQIAKKSLPDGMQVYQVISRPMTSQRQVAEAQSRLQDNGIDSLIVEQRRTP